MRDAPKGGERRLLGHLEDDGVAWPHFEKLSAVWLQRTSLLINRADSDLRQAPVPTSRMPSAALHPGADILAHYKVDGSKMAEIRSYGNSMA